MAVRFGLSDLVIKLHMYLYVLASFRIKLSYFLVMNVSYYYHLLQLSRGYKVRCLFRKVDKYIFISTTSHRGVYQDSLAENRSSSVPSCGYHIFHSFNIHMESSPLIFSKLPSLPRKPIYVVVEIVNFYNYYYFSIYLPQNMAYDFQENVLLEQMNDTVRCESLINCLICRLSIFRC